MKNDKQTLQFGEVVDTIVTQNAGRECLDGACVTNWCSPAQSDSPQNLLVFKNAVEYDPEAELLINQHSRARSLCKYWH